MDFIQSQETLTVNEWILRAIVAFFFLLIVARIIRSACYLPIKTS